MVVTADREALEECVNGGTVAEAELACWWEGRLSQLYSVVEEGAMAVAEWEARHDRYELLLLSRSVAWRPNHLCDVGQAGQGVGAVLAKRGVVRNAAGNYLTRALLPLRDWS